MSNTLPGTPLDIPVPPQLEAAVEYHGDARFFALYWTPGGDEAVVTDGRTSHDGCWWGYQAFVDHPLVALALAGHRYDLGCSEWPATHWLVVDRTSRSASLAPVEEAGRFLDAQHPPLPRVKVTREEWSEIVEQVRAEMEAYVARLNSLDMQAILRSQDGIVTAMTTWLNEHLPANWQTQIMARLLSIEDAA